VGLVEREVENREAAAERQGEKARLEEDLALASRKRLSYSDLAFAAEPRVLSSKLTNSHNIQTTPRRSDADSLSLSAPRDEKADKQ
jgi:hypothetical protein